MRVFPDMVPVPTWPDYSLQPRAQSFRTDMEVGDQKARRITRAKRWDVDLNWRMTDEEAGLFWPWYHDDPWSLSGDSDSLAGFSSANSSVLTDYTAGPDGQLAERMVENSINSGHNISKTLTGVPLNSVLRASMTCRAGSRGFVRLGIMSLAGVFSSTAMDLATGAWTTGSGYLARKAKDRGNGWWRIEMTASMGSGVTTPYFVLNMGTTGTTFSYLGDGAGYLDICEQQARVVSGADGFLGTDAAGNIQGAGAGEAWFTMPVPAGGGIVRREVQLTSAPSAKPLNGRPNWNVGCKAVVR